MKTVDSDYGMRHLKSRNPVGVENVRRYPRPRVVRNGQPWAIGRNPFGVTEISASMITCIAGGGVFHFNSIPTGLRLMTNNVSGVLYLPQRGYGI